MYSVGEKIMYGGTGVCVVEDITMVKLSGMEQPRQYYTLRPLYQSGIIQTPVDNEKIPIRPVNAYRIRKKYYFCVNSN